LEQNSDRMQKAEASYLGFFDEKTLFIPKNIRFIPKFVFQVILWYNGSVEIMLGR